MRRMFTNFWWIVLIFFLGCRTTEKASDSNAVRTKGSKVFLVPIPKDELSAVRFTDAKEHFSLSIATPDHIKKDEVKQTLINFSSKYEPHANSPAFKKFEAWTTAEEAQGGSSLKYTHAVVIYAVDLRFETSFSPLREENCVTEIRLSIYKNDGSLVGKYAGVKQIRCYYEGGRPEEYSYKDWPSVQDAFEDAISKIDTI